MIALLTIPEVSELASARFRKLVPNERVHAWLASGLLSSLPGAGQPLVRSDYLERLLDKLEAEERLLTIQEACDWLRTRHGITVAKRTVRDWCERGVIAPGGQVLRLPRQRCPWDKRQSWYVIRMDLDALIKAVPNLGKPGRPLNGRRTNKPRRKKRRVL